ncbi:Translation factor, SUA5 type [Rhodopirellula maiorica SM1]|uniref:Threonylcarbamoyl-AMP synthase n=1 Tax=Rhodopirellula maiorica SM1 TaxID=1265738 RepID=M5REC3_9BACT|nr:L-threonylcarbamoyladenylate synthase [Rhodopirellula maiorica]EMI17798.1 Translation factor, SUA5 type [Rhodopirellula maiorica SM1]
MTLIQPASDDVLDRAAALLAAGKLIAIPTETVYGLAANAWDRDAVAKIFAAKQRPATNPLIVHIAAVDRMDQAVKMPLAPVLQRQLDCVVGLWPGPLTVVLPRADRISDSVTAGRDTVAVRIPSHPVALRLLERCSFPIAAPSANRSNYVSPTMAKHCDGAKDQPGIHQFIEMVIDGGDCDFGVESTIVALRPEGPKLLRPGGVSAESLAERFGISVSDLTGTTAESESPPDAISKSTAAMMAPGMMKEHYSPTTPLMLCDSATGMALPPRVGRIAFKPLPAADAARYTVVETLSDSEDLHEVAKGLFAALRRLDHTGLDLILIDHCEPVGIGMAIMDRIHRAAAKHAD